MSYLETGFPRKQGRVYFGERKNHLVSIICNMKNVKLCSGCISWDLYYNNSMLKKSLVNGEKDTGEHENERN